jgi:hypothetical protein
MYLYKQVAKPEIIYRPQSSWQHQYHMHVSWEQLCAGMVSWEACRSKHHTTRRAAEPHVYLQGVNSFCAVFMSLLAQVPWDNASVRGKELVTNHVRIA